MMTVLLYPLAFASLLLSGAIFGFFYAWVCSAMWGLDAIDPRAAITAMQAINEAVRNAVFMPAFFLTPLAMLVTAALSYGSGLRLAALSFAGGGAVYLFGGLILTMQMHIPMNEALAQVPVPTDIDAAATIWEAYSPSWQFWNVMRTLASGLALLGAGAGLLLLGRGR